jgi:hypothetical protein
VISVVVPQQWQKASSVVARRVWKTAPHQEGTTAGICENATRRLRRTPNDSRFCVDESMNIPPKRQYRSEQRKSHEEIPVQVHHDSKAQRQSGEVRVQIALSQLT